MSTRAKPRIIFGGIDGTSPHWNDGEYEKIFETSFVHLLHNGWSHGPARYERGPTTLEGKPANWTFGSAYRILAHVESNWKPGESAVFWPATVAAVPPSSKSPSGSKVDTSRSSV